MAEEQPQQPGLFDNLFGAVADPFPLFEQFRKASPVVKLPGDLSIYAVFRYDDVVRILRDPETFSSRVDAISMRGDARPPTILFDDPPVHTRMRGLLTKAFTPRVIEEQRPAITVNARRMISAMLAEDAPDVIAHLAYPLPVGVIAGMLGVQDGDLATFKRWSDAIIQNVGNSLVNPDSDAIADVNAEFDAYFGERLAKLRRQPEQNLLSELVHAVDDDGNRLSVEDLMVVCRVLLVAGNETTTGLLVNLVRVFSQFPEVVARVKSDMSLVPSLVEETLRFYPPFPATIRRAMRDVEVAGTVIPKDARILAMLASANRDESVFDRAGEFVVDRDPNRHLGFGMGIHYCLGAPLARLEGNIAMDVLLPRIAGLKILDAQDDAVLRPGGPSAMRVQFVLDAAHVAAAV
jgi:cytochrome P450